MHVRRGRRSGNNICENDDGPSPYFLKNSLYVFLLTCIYLHNHYFVAVCPPPFTHVHHPFFFLAFLFLLPLLASSDPPLSFPAYKSKENVKIIHTKRINPAPPFLPFASILLLVGPFSLEEHKMSCVPRLILASTLTHSR